MLQAHILYTCAFHQGLYKDGERFGPGITTYTDGTCDVGLWCRERLIKLCSSVSATAFPQLLHRHRCNPDEHRKRIPKVVRVRSHLETASRSAVSLHVSPNQNNSEFESDPEDIAKAVVSDLLPVSSLAADLHSYDEAFFICSQSFFCSANNFDCTASSGGQQVSNAVTHESSVNDGVDANLTNSRSQLVESVMALPMSDQDLEQEMEDNIMAWNNTASCIAMQMNILRHRAAQSTVGFDVDLVVAGDRGSSDRGVIEIASERFILAADAGDLTTVTQLLNNGDVNVDVADSRGYTALFAAVVCINFVSLEFSCINYNLPVPIFF